jgi:hypothetical protein
MNDDVSPIRKLAVSKTSVLLGVILLFVAGAFAGSWASAKTGHFPFRPAPALFEVASAAGDAVGKDVSFSNGFASVARRVLYCPRW